MKHVNAIGSDKCQINTETIDSYMKKQGWKKIGDVCVDTGTLMIADPCNVGKLDVSDAIDDMIRNGENSTQINFRTHAKNPAIVVTSTGYGDGFYPVETREEDGRVAELRIRFL